MGSRAQEVARLDWKSLMTSLGERGEKEERWEEGRYGLGERTGGGKEELMSETFLVKNERKSLAVMEEGGGGEGGLRREEKVEKS